MSAWCEKEVLSGVAPEEQQRQVPVVFEVYLTTLQLLFCFLHSPNVIIIKEEMTMSSDSPPSEIQVLNDDLATEAATDRATTNRPTDSGPVAYTNKSFCEVKLLQISSKY